MISFEDLYFTWLCELIKDPNDPRICDRYHNVLYILYHTDYTWTHPMDANRADDGYDLRVYFADDIKVDHRMIYSYFCQKNTSVLEMMIALAVRCENDIMSDFDHGNRTHVWFWSMIQSLGLEEQDNDHFFEEYVVNQIDTFLKKEYKPDGEGGLFYIPDYPFDLRNDEIWVQMNRYLNMKITKGEL